MPKVLRLPDYVNSFNFIHIADKGNFYEIKMYSIVDHGDNTYSKLDGSLAEEETYTVQIDKQEPKIYY